MPSKNGRELLIIMPAYNEEECIGPFLDKLNDEGLSEIADVLVINDGSTDDTSKIAKSKGARVITHIYNLGYGSALQSGYKFAVRYGYDYVIQIDSDGQHDPCNIKTILTELKSCDNPPDIVIGSRFFQNSQTFHISWIKRITIGFFRFMIHQSTKQVVLDPTSGLQGLNKRAFLYYSYYNNFNHEYPDANMIIQTLLNDYVIKEVPAIMHPRETGTSMHSGLKPIMYVLKMMLEILTVIAREKLIRGKRR